jgi:GNAT superfamily N-acetyltransferase
MTGIRPMSVTDAERAAQLTTQLGYPVDARTLRARFAAVRASAADEILVATDAEDAAIGWIHVARLALLEASDLACINGLVVDEAHRSDGIGAELVAAAEAWARDHGATSIMVRSRSARVRAHRFYERIGYVEVKRSHVFTKSLV